MKHVKSFKKLNESPDTLYLEYDNIKLEYTDDDAVIFGFDNGEVIISKRNDDSYSINKHVNIFEQGRDLDYPGRMWLDAKFISFWEYPPENEMKYILKQIEKAYNYGKKYFKIVFKTSDGELKDHNLEKRNGNYYYYEEKVYLADGQDEDFKNHGWNARIFYSLEENGFHFDDDWKIEIVDIGGVNKYYSNREYPEKIVPLSDYLGSDKRSEEEVKAPHLMNPKEKEEYWKKNRLTDWGSELKAKKNPIWWEQAKRTSENVLSFDSYLILEGRKEDLLSKYQKEFGKGLGEVVFDLDPTDNKAYSDWLFHFFKNNRKELGVSETLNLPRKEMLKTEWLKDGKKLDILRYMIKKFENNKILIGTPIIKIKTMKDFIKVLDKKDGFDKIENYSEKDVKVYHNGAEWLVFQPFTYETSQFANKKNREKNWCTTYDEGQFQNYLGEKGGLLYCINKLDSTQDMAFQLRPNESIIPYDYNDQEQRTLYSFYDMKEEFDEDSEIYQILDEVEHEVDFPQIDKNQLKEDVYNFYYSFDDIMMNKDLYLKLLDDSNYLNDFNDFISSEIDYYTIEFASEFLPAFDAELEHTFEWIWKNTGKFNEYFGISYGVFWKDEGYPDIDDFIESLEKPETLKKQHYEENTKYDRSDCYTQIENFLEKYNKKENFVKYYFKNEKYRGYTSEDIISEFYGNPYDMSNKELTEIGDNYVDFSDYIKAYVDTLSVDEMMEIIYSE